MPTVNVYDAEMRRVGELDLKDSVFGAAPLPHLVHEVVTAQLASRRRGTADTLTRAEVSFSNRKPYRQKKTGRARMGTRRSPLLRKGGVIFGPRPRDYSRRPPSRVRKKALISVLSAFLQEERLIVLDGLRLDVVKTKSVAELIAKTKFPGAVLAIPEKDPVLEMSARNLPHVKVLRSGGLNCYDLLKYRHLVILKDAVPLIEDRLD
ncbi:MAG: 50S ribosomal protein L4 [Deltaproteobacteria bacterium]|jgi:large subunit ribosomal protein L4|nr:50S ribosomal protein L4 [Deltaproteobacteria bacterium]